METYKVIHIGCTQQIHSRVVCPLNEVIILTTRRIIRTIPKPILRREESDISGPLPRLIRPVSICLVAGVLRQSRSNIKETAVRNCVLVTKPFVPGEYLPSKPAIARRGIPSHRLRIENGLRQRKPLRLIGGWIREIPFCSRHCCHTPKRLIVVSFRHCLILGHEVCVGASLPQQRLSGHVVPCAVAGVCPVVDQSAEHCACFPPKVGIW